MNELSKEEPKGDRPIEVIYITRYLSSGVLNSVLGFIVIFSLMWFGAPPLLANVAGYAVGFLLGFVLSKNFVFRSNGHFVGEGVRYLLAFLSAFLVNLAVLHISITYLLIHEVLSQLIAAGSYTVVMYVLTRFYVFEI